MHSLGSSSPKDQPGRVNRPRRRLLSQLTAMVGLVGFGMVNRAQAQDDASGLRFPGEEPEHKIVYQFNQIEPEYQEHVLFSVGEMVRKYGDNVGVVVTAFGPGIHILAKQPGRPVNETIQQRVSSLSQYGVEFHACGNTMKSLKWTAEDLVPFAQVVEVGAADIMELQEKGYAYLAW